MDRRKKKKISYYYFICNHSIEVCPKGRGCPKNRDHSWKIEVMGCIALCFTQKTAGQKQFAVLDEKLTREVQLVFLKYLLEKVDNSENIPKTRFRTTDRIPMCHFLAFFVLF